MGRTLPTECPHGRILDWGDFGPDPDADYGGEPEHCEICEREGVVVSVEDDVRIQAAATDYGGWRWKVAHHLSPDGDIIRHITTCSDDLTIAIVDSDFDEPERDAEAIANAHNRFPLYIAFVRAAVEELGYEISKSPKTAAALDRIKEQP